MPLSLVKIPEVVKKMFPNYVWDIPTSDKVIYLTFDDGPTPEITDWTLKILNDFEAKATFFCIGNNVEKHPEIFQNIIKTGHAIGNHTHNHLKGWKTKKQDYLKNIKSCDNAFKLHLANSNQVEENEKEDKNKNIKLFRPPYGRLTPGQGKALLAMHYKIIMWDVLSFDWDIKTSKEDCLSHVINNTEKGSVVVFHDSIKASKNMQYVLPKVLKHFTNLGYSFESIPH
ncbi:polysaccharide deacetylase family protein [Aestuariibaculum sediminum]|uniref:Polysaccharide deacetylase family protein n=1 Tax=Aestuariibaculum sediminum TaxID=2770637 RepID=A0A8J6U8U7_9FLAO|nr:polysaccharide deacetylase family protein [Aestuariibaculum sediminum]MBD0833505.1 polysaccharide deacetylase family protein [Aestuariibaculum sediminum]